MTHTSLTPLSTEAKRIAYGGMHVDLVKTSQGTVRIGSMPDISKFLNFYGFREEIVMVPDWQVSMAGDNHTGEEFVLWQAQVKGGLCKDYVGRPENVNQMRHNLDETFSYFFDSRRLAIVKKRWLSRWFAPCSACPDWKKGALQIQVAHNTIRVTDHGRIVYDSLEFRPAEDPDEQVETVLASVARDARSRQDLEITALGTGNGFVDTVSSCLVRFEKVVMLIDPCGYPAHNLARHGVHWDDVTHILITHNHEDHTQGFSACLNRAEKTATPLRLITAPGIYALLRKQFLPLCPGFDSHVIFIPMVPGTPLSLDYLRIDSRWNHHFLPYGTLGLRISAGGKTLGFSGDTKLDETINAILKRDELTPSWFSSCDLVFHEVDFDNPTGVYTHWKQVEKLQQVISGRVLGYHTPFLANAPLDLVREGKTYSL
ncbi:MAG: MBL fold metallo-hydrolase [Desulfotignum sp.]|nr:MBL fold metallo-hydrolase [Desulfotignum sp.]